MSAYCFIGIHGLSNKPPAKVLQAWWCQSIVEGFARNLKLDVPHVELQLVYWADIMYPEGPMLLDLERRVLNPDPERYEIDPYTPATTAGDTPESTLGFAMLARRLGKEALGGLLDGSSAMPGLSTILQRFLAHKVRDLHKYYHDAERRLVICERLVAALRQAMALDQSIVLIAHSMGSIVAFDVLGRIEHELPGLRIAQFMTLGSPLGLWEIKRRIRAQGIALAVPDSVEAWTNYADTLDTITLDSSLRTDFTANKSGVQVTDVTVCNDYISPDKVPNHHKIYGYLRAPQVSLDLVPWITDELVDLNR